MEAIQHSNYKQCSHQLSELSLYSKYADFASIPPTVSKPMSPLQRQYLVKARLGILPVREHTRTFTRPITPREERVCKVYGHGEGGGELEDIGIAL